MDWSKPQNHSTRLSIPIVSLGQSVSLTDQLEFTGIKPFYNISITTQISKTIVPQQPKIVWMHDGHHNRGISVKDVRDNLLPNEQAGSIYDALAFVIVHKDIHRLLRTQALSIPGSTADEGKAPFLFWWYGEIELRQGKVDLTGTAWGSLLSSK